jgi:hypothetical protein
MRRMPPADRDVLTSLPRSRSTRRSAKRAGKPQDAAPAVEPQPEAKTPAAAKSAATRAAAKPKPKAPATKPKPKAKPAAKAAAGTPPKAHAPTSPPPPPAGWAAPRPGRDDGGRGELLGTAVQAVGELAQIGLAYGGQALKQALSRLPKP